MQKYSAHTRGIGVLAVVAIVAVIGIGGAAAVQVYNQQKASINTDESAEMAQNKTAEVKSGAREELIAVRTELAADFNTNAEAALETLADVRADLTDAYVNADAELRAELDEIGSAIAEAEARIEARSETALESVGEAIRKLGNEAESSTNTEGDTKAGISVEEEGVKRTLENDAEIQVQDQDNDKDAAAGTEAETSMEAESTTSVGIDGSSLDVEADVAAEGSASDSY